MQKASTANAVRAWRTDHPEPATDVQPVHSLDGTSGRSFAERSALSAMVLAALPGLEGWCSERKAVWLADLVAGHGCGQVLEIGAFGGRSLIPMALAVRQCVPAGGRAYAVESWSSEPDAPAASSTAIDAWWRDVELAAVKAGFMRSLLDNELAGIVSVLEMSADEALLCLTAIGIRDFDLIHFAGRGAADKGLSDVEAWSGLLRPGGIIVLDNICLPQVQEAREHLWRTLSVIEEVVEPDGASYGAYRSRT